LGAKNRHFGIPFFQSAFSDILPEVGFSYVFLYNDLKMSIQQFFGRSSPVIRYSPEEKSGAAAATRFILNGQSKK